MFNSSKHKSARVKHILASHNGQGHPAPKKRSGGGVGMHKGYSRGNNSADIQADMRPESAEHSDVYTEGVKRSKRIPRAHGGKVGKPLKVQINHINVGHPGMLGPGAGGPPMPAGPGLPPPGMPPMVRNQGGAVSYGSGTGMSRLAEFHKLRGEGH
jgi:hypothetical protein